MDESRWPPGIRKFIDDAAAKVNGPLTVDVEYSAPVWTVRLGCQCCGLARMWNLAGEVPVPDPEAIPLPDAFREILA